MSVCVCVCMCVCIYIYITHLRQECHNSKFVIFQEKFLKVLKCYNFLWVQRWHNCSPVASFANCVMTLYLLKVHLQTFLFIPITQKCQILSCDTLVSNERYIPKIKIVKMFVRVTAICRNSLYSVHSLKNVLKCI
jgi:hypothetical protein